MGQSGGSITLRVGLAGSDEVKATLASLGPAGAAALRQIEASQAGPTTGMRALNAASEEVRDKLKEIGGEAGSLGTVLQAVGLAGAFAAAGIGAMLLVGDKIVESVHGAMEFAESLETAAKAAGVSTTSLQKYRYAAEQSGVATEAADSAIRKFTTSFGLAGEGQKRYLQFFEKLGFTPEQLKSFSSVDEALDATVTKIAGLGNAADRAAFAKKLGLAELLPLLQGGATNISKLKDEAVSLGVVMDDQTVRVLAESEKKFKSLSDVISTQLKSSVVGMTQPLLDMTRFLADLIKGMGAFLDKFRDVGQQSLGTLQARHAELVSQLPGASHTEFRSSGGGRGAAAEVVVVNPADRLVSNGGRGPQHWASDPVRAELAANEAAQATIRVNAAASAAQDKNLTAPALGGFDGSSPKAGRRGGKGSKTTTPEQQAVNDASLQDSGEIALDNAKKAELQSQLSLTSDVTEREKIQSQIAALEEQAAQTAQDKMIADKAQQAIDGKISMAEFHRWMAIEDAVTVAKQNLEKDKEALAERNRDVALMKQSADLEKAEYESKLTRLKAQLAITTNAEQRRVLALDIYDLEYREKLAQLQATLATEQNDGHLTQAAIAQLQIIDLVANNRAGRQAVSNANPANDWDKMLIQMKADATGLNQEFGTMAADGVAQFNSSLFDAQGRLQSLGSIAGSVFSKMLVDLEQYLLKQAEIGLFGGGGGLGSLLGGLFGGGGAAAGGSIFGGAGFMPFAFTGLAGGGRIAGPGGPRDDKILIAASDGEYMVNAQATARYLPILDAINSGRPIAIPHFAAGGMVGGGGANGVRLGATHVTLNIDRSIHAPGADSAALQRVADRQAEILRGEPERWVGYYMQAQQTPGLRRS
jgi:hypothetical protein